MADFSANDKFDPKKNFTQVKFGADAPLLETELNEMQKILSEARAGITRQAVHSGVLDHSTSFVNSHNISSIRGGIGASNQSSFNALFFGEFDSLVNGYKISTPMDLKVELSSPPTFGTREDLVFLEAWFEEIDATEDASIKDARIGVETSRRVKLNWRIRTVAGVDFNKWKEGFNVSHTDGYVNRFANNFAVPQGGNGATLDGSTFIANDYFFCSPYLENGTPGGIKRGLKNADAGIYIAGEGNQISKDLLKTADGYVYAIPLFRVKRRNSGGYRSDNLNGARDYYKQLVSLATGLTGSKTYNVGESFTFTVSDSHLSIFDTVKTGDKVSASATDLALVESFDKATKKITLKFTTLWIDATAEGFVIDIGSLSDRPDGLFSNIIDKDDIIDLRHKVSLTGVNYQQLLEENFDKLLRGELQTKEKPKMNKERFGLTPAPLGLVPQLLPTKVKGNDGVERDLLNLLGTVESSYRLNVATWTKLANNEYKIDSIYGDSGASWDLSSHVGKKIIVLVEAKQITGYTSSIFFSDVFNGRRGAISGAPWTNLTTDYQLYVMKVTLTDIIKWFRTDYSTQIRNLRIFEIDQATYDKIGVDPEFTGEKLAQKFPYVSSYPSVLENYFDPTKFPATSSLVSVKPIETGVNLKGTFYTRYPVNFPSGTVLCANWTTQIVSGVGNNSWLIEYSDATIAFSVGKGTPITASKDVVAVYVYASDATTSEVNYTNLELVKGDRPNLVYVPFGRWLVPTDYANGETLNRFSLQNSRQILSDAQTSETVTEIVEALKTPQKNITVTQATEGTWAVGDTIKIKSDVGVISGVIDADTALAKILLTQDITGGTTRTVSVDDVSKLAVNDTFQLYYNDNGMFTVYGVTCTITAVDSANKTITFNDPNGSGLYTNTQYYIFETTASTSVPIVKAILSANGTSTVIGSSFVTFTGLGTKEVIATIVAVTNLDVTKPLSFQYSVSYPSGKGIQQVPTEVLEAKVNGEKLVKATDNIIRIKANFNGKLAGNADLVPHVGKYSANTTLLAPSSQTTEFPQPWYTSCVSLDGGIFSNNQTSNGNIGQQLFSFDIIRAITDKFGEGVFTDCLTLADKVAKAKTIITKLTGNWFGYGSSVGGNKAVFTVYGNGAYYSPTTNHSNNTVTKLVKGPFTSADISIILQSDGFVHFLAHAEPSDGVILSVINTDYVELELELNVAETGYDVLVPENQFPVLVDHPSRFKEGENMLPPATSYSLSIGGVINSDYDFYTPITAQTFNSFTVKIPILSNAQYTLSLGELVDGDVFVYCFNGDNSIGPVSGVGMNPSTKDKFTFTTLPNTNILHLEFSTSTRTSGTSIFRKPMLTPGSQSRKFVPYIKRIKRERKLDFLGKVVGSTFENPHKALRSTNTGFGVPSTFSIEENQQAYSDMSKADGVLRTYSSSTSTLYVQQMYEFDLSNLGLSLSELKSALRKLTVKWTGYGSGDSAGVQTFGATMKAWRENLSNWVLPKTNTASTPSTVGLAFHSEYPIADIPLLVTKDQKVFILVHSTYPASATNLSEIVTDYISLEVELADYVDYVPANVVKVRKETKEVKLQYPAKSNRFGQVSDLELFYKYTPYQGIGKQTATSSPLLVPKSFLLTTLGTGRYRGRAPILDKIPLKSADLLYKLTDVLDSKQYYTEAVSMLVPTEGLAFDFYKNYGSGKIGDGFGIVIVAKKDTTAKNPLIIACGLYNINGEIQLRVATREWSKGNAGEFFDWDSNAIADHFKLEGIPLIKGVN